jgi:ribosomal protein S18 acetylase RimI-like enzyme
MTITRRPYQGAQEDDARIAHLLEGQPEARRHLIDQPWKLSSPPIQGGKDACLWEDEHGQVLAFAAWQLYWATLDLFVRTGPRQQAVEDEIFAWAEKRFRELDQERGNPLPYWIEYRDDDPERRQLAEARGFLLDEDRYVQFHRSLNEPLPAPTLPDGFTLRPLAGEQEAGAYAELHRAAFESTSMTAEWRARTLRMPQHRADLDLVIAAPDGRLAGFIVGWYDPRRRIGQIEPMGVHPDFQGLGLSRALLLAIFQRFHAAGADYALVETNLERDPARHAYEAVGFRQAHIVRAKGKWIAN